MKFLDCNNFPENIGNQIPPEVNAFESSVEGQGKTFVGLEG